MITNSKSVRLIGSPVELGAGQIGCAMGTAAIRVAKLRETLEEIGHAVVDLGNLNMRAAEDVVLAGNALNASDIIGWARALNQSAYQTLQEGHFPIFMGGDHSLSMGSVSGAARHAAERSQPLHVLWLDAHSDFNTPQTSPSGNMHGMPVAFCCGEPGFEGVLASDAPVLDPKNVHMLGIRSVDSIERQLISERGVDVHDMRDVDERGIATIVREIVDKVKADKALLHVSLDVDFLDPSIAPGVGTTVPGGATFREAHLVMEMLHEADLVTSLDLVELNPYLDDRGASARMLVNLTASLFGQKIFERRTSVN